MKKVILTIDGKTQAWQRIVPANPFNKFSKPHKEKETVTFQNYVRWCYTQKTTEFFDCPVKITIRVNVTPPKSVSKKMYKLMLQNIIKPDKKPDWDNLGKNVSDALNKVAYPDDAKITDGGVKKRYATHNFAQIIIEEDTETGVWVKKDGEWEFVDINECEVDIAEMATA